MTTPTEDLDRMIRRIKGLLAKADPERNPNLNEAEAAAALAQELITRHQVTEAQLAAHTGPKDKAQIVSLEYFARGDSNLQKWERTLCNGICLTNQCRLLIYRGSTHLTIFGTQSNIAIVIELFEELRSLVRELSHSAYKAYGYGQPTAWKTSFCLGATTALIRRMKDASTKVVQETGSTALMVLEDQRAETAMKGYSPHIKFVRNRKGPSNSSAFSAGYEAGQSLPITTTKKIT